MTEKPSRNEEEYFARLEAERLKARKAAAEEAAVDAQRKQHYMKCPKCGANLATEEYHGIQVDRCPECQGVWFDAGEVEQLVDQESGGIGSVFKAIVRGVKGKTPTPGSE